MMPFWAVVLLDVQDMHDSLSESRSSWDETRSHGSFLALTQLLWTVYLQPQIWDNLMLIFYSSLKL